MTKFIIVNTIWVAVTVSLSNAFLLDGIKDKIIEMVSPPVDTYLSKFLYCSQCIGFWVGVFGSFIIKPEGIDTWLYPVLQGFLTSFFSYTVTSLIKYN